MSPKDSGSNQGKARPDSNTRNSVRIGRALIDRVSFQETIQQILSLVSASHSGVKQIVTVNAQFVTIAQREERMAHLMETSALSVADGVPLLWVAHSMGAPLRGRVNGTDLMVGLCEQAASHGKSVYFLGGRPQAAEFTAQCMQANFPGLIVAGVDCPPWDFEKNPTTDKEVADRIDTAEPDIVFIALGAPKAEYWIQDHRHLRAKVMIGIGGSFELAGGMVKRAPILFQRCGAEWLWRVCMEPRRLSKRYLFSNTQFVFIVFSQYLRKGKRRTQKEEMV